MNKYQRAIDDVARYCSDYRTGMEKPTKELTNELDILNELVEKAKPKKPRKSGYKPTKLDKFFGGQETYVCPTCRNQCLVMIAPNGRNTNKYCYDCGQALDWSEEE